MNNYTEKIRNLDKLMVVFKDKKYIFNQINLDFHNFQVNYLQEIQESFKNQSFERQCFLVHKLKGIIYLFDCDLKNRLVKMESNLVNHEYDKISMVDIDECIVMSKEMNKILQDIYSEL